MPLLELQAVTRFVILHEFSTNSHPPVQEYTPPGLPPA